MDWDKLRIFQAAADAGSFTRAGETLGLSQSAISRQVGALESDLGAPLFHRHARGLILTEQGEMLLGAVRDVVLKLDAVRSRLIDSREKPHGDLRVTTTLGLGANWLAPRLGEFVELYPEVKLQLLLSDDDLDLSRCARRTSRCACASRCSLTSSDAGSSPSISTPMRRPITSGGARSRARSRISTTIISSPSARRRRPICSTTSTRCSLSAGIRRIRASPRSRSTTSGR